MNTFGERTPVCFTHGDGIYLYGTDGRQYTDLIGGIAVNVLGHANKALAGAIAEQASALIHCSNLYYIEKQSLLAEKLVELAPGMDKVFFGNSGAEANEGAIKLARAFFYKQGAPRAKIVSAVNSFHGRTIATVTATGQEKYSKPFAPLPEGFEHVPFNDIDALKRSVDDSTCAVMLELIQGESGIIRASVEYIGVAAALCRKHGALLILDEVQTGMGRCGTFFAYEQFGITPDIVTIAKGLGGGFPIGALLASDGVASAFAPGDHGSTFGGNPLACAAALAVLQEYGSNGLTAKAAASGDYFRSALEEVAASSGKIAEIRGMGLMIGIVLKDPDAAGIKSRLLADGYLVNSIGGSVIRLLPPLIIEDHQIDAFCRTLLEELK
ncbi:MAG: acetylornithine/succinylornithine family transaminase [Saccharofermentanales bacterium]